MVDVNEPTRIARRLERQWTLLEEADIDDRDRAAIRAFVEKRRDIERRSRNTLCSDLSSLRVASERADRPLVDMTLEDVEGFFSVLCAPEAEGGYALDVDGSSMYSYARSFRLFYRYIDERASYDDYPFHDAIELPDVEVKGTSSRDEMLSGEDIEALKDAARHPRDRALIAFLADIGGRITMALSLRVGDLELDGDEPSFTPNDDVVDGLKDLDVDEIPILHSRAELRTYVRHHHPDPVPEAPLWAKLRGYDPDARQESAVSGTRIRTMLKDCRDRAGIDKPVEPHNFRRTAATRLSNADRLTPQEIQQITGWKDSVLFEMLSTYDLTTDSERNSGIQRTLGFSKGNGGDEEDLAVQSIPCGTCREMNPSSARYCSNCGAAMDEAAQAEARQTEDETFEDTTTAASVGAVGDIQTFEEFRTRFNADPAFRERFLRGDHGESSS